MSSKVDLAVISCYGRGQWLAAEAKDQGLSVAFIDVTDSLGRWAPEDIEGPFGLLTKENLKQSQLARLDAENHSDNIVDGFTLFLKTGPLDMRGTHSKYLMEQLLIPDFVQEYVQDSIMDNGRSTAKRRIQLERQIAKLPFAKKWLAAMVQSIASPIARPSYEAFSEGREALPIAAPYDVRRVSRRGAEKLLLWLKDRGVTVHDKAKLVDLAIDGHFLKHVEVESAWSGVVQAEQFVWALTSSETDKVKKSIGFELFGNLRPRPTWVWMRYRLEMLGRAAQVLPIKFWLVEDLALAWTHHGLLAIQRTTSPDHFDVWVRMPETHRFQKAYMDETLTEIQNLLRRRLPAVEFKAVEQPQEYNYDESQLGPACFMQFDEEELSRLKQRPLKNIFYDGPECWEQLDWNGQFTAQNKIILDLIHWRDEREKKRLKEQGL